MKTYKTIEGDTVDIICHQLFGLTASMVEEVYKLNPHLAKLGVHLPVGTEINMPENSTTETYTTTKLWD